MALSCVDGSFYARVNLSDFDVCRHNLFADLEFNEIVTIYK